MFVVSVCVSSQGPEPLARGISERASCTNFCLSVNGKHSELGGITAAVI